MGSTNDDLERKSKYRKHHDRRRSGTVSWANIGADIVRDAISAVAKSGGCLRMGYTRDQGAYAIGIYGEGDPYTEYFHSVQDCTEFLLEIIGDYADGGETGIKTPF